MKTHWLIVLFMAGAVALGLLLYLLQPNAFLRTQVAIPARPASKIFTPQQCDDQYQACRHRCETDPETGSGCVKDCETALSDCF